MKLTTAIWDMPAEVHAVHGRYSADRRPAFPPDHVMDAKCPCKPVVNWRSTFAPKPLYEHR